MQLKQVGEFKLIDIISRQVQTTPPVVKGIGDDAAVLRFDKSNCIVITTDILTENIHFRQDLTTPYLLGKKALAVNLSDIAAMGATPCSYFVSLSAPANTSLNFIRNIYRGMNAVGRHFGACLAGGDTSASSREISITVTAIGTAAQKDLIYRNGARKGDLVFVTGCLGDSCLGLEILKKKISANRNRLAMRHLYPSPRVQTGLEIARLGIATSMIDISDGLASDLEHILEQSSKGAVIHLSKLPLSHAYRKMMAGDKNRFYYPAVCGGEDYELLFTVPPEKKKKAERLPEKTGVPVSCIGEITADTCKLVMLDKNSAVFRPEKKGYRHFQAG